MGNIGSHVDLTSEPVGPQAKLSKNGQILASLPVRRKIAAGRNETTES
jgi:hypothetical protein